MPAVPCKDLPSTRGACVVCAGAEEIVKAALLAWPRRRGTFGSMASTPLLGKTILHGVTGSIAAPKAVELVGLLRKLGAEVRPILTAAGARFVTPLTLQTVARHPVATDLWTPMGDWHPAHIALAESADLLLVAPATAHVIAQFAHGLAPDLLTSLYLACRAPVLIAPAMNANMFEHPATRRNVETLRERGHEFIGPEDGMLACGTEGPGRLWPVDRIARRVEEILAPKRRPPRRRH